VSTPFALLGARVKRLDVVGDSALALSLAQGSERAVLLVAIGARVRGIGLCDARPAGAAAEGFARAARRHVEGARVGALRWAERGEAVIELGKGPLQLRLFAFVRNGRRACALLEGEARVLAAEPSDLDALALATAAPETPLLDADALARSEAGDALFTLLSDDGLERRRAELRQVLRAAATRLRRRLHAVQGDLARADQIPNLRRDAGLLLSHLQAVDGLRHVLVTQDETTDPPTPLTLAIDPALGPKRQAEAWFGRARKLERGIAIARARMESTRGGLDRVDALGARLDDARTLDELDALAGQADRLGLTVGQQPSTRGKAATQPRLPYREFVGDGERRILVGRGAEDNDRLTLDHARPGDLWLHARAVAGSHVIVPLERNEACPSELLCDAATLAAHFSKARGERLTDVLHVQRRYVRKPRKAPAGQVVLDREKVFRLQLEPRRLERLLASERAPRRG